MIADKCGEVAGSAVVKVVGIQDNPPLPKDPRRIWRLLIERREGEVEVGEEKGG